MEETDRDTTRREILKRAGLGGAALALPALIAACGGSGSSGGGQLATTAKHVKVSGAEIPTLTWSAGAAPPTLDIATGFIESGIAVEVVALEGLLTLDGTLALKPLLAKSWSQPDPLHYVYKLRSGVTFWDGMPLTAEDAAYSIGRHIDPKVASQLGSYFINVKSVEATGADEVTITMKRPDPVFQYVPVFSFITPKKFSEKMGKSLGAPGPKVTTMGTGPYQITSFDANSGVTLVRNERYWGAKPAVRKATVKFISSPETELLAMRSGGIKGQFEFPIAQASDWSKLPSTTTQYAPPMRVVYLSFDLSMPPFDDLHVRRAIAYAADRKGYIDAFLDGHGEVADAIVSPAQWTNLLSASEVQRVYSKLPPYAFSVDQAKAELKKSAHAGGFAATIMYPNVFPEVGNALVSLAQTLKQLKIELNVKEVTQNQWLANVYGHKDLGLLLMTLGPDYPDPADYPVIVYPSVNAVKNNFNTANFKNAQVDALLRKQSNTTDKAVRAKALEQVLQISQQQLPYFPLWFQNSTMAISSRFVLQPFTSLYYYRPWLAEIQSAA